MAVTNPFSIKYGSRTVGGATAYQLLGPYVIDKSYDAIRLVFDVFITADTAATIQSLSDDLETDFRTRLTAGDTLVIDTGAGTVWTYTVGQTILKVRASLAKAGNPDTDKGFSRAYTVSIEGEPSFQTHFMSLASLGRREATIDDHVQAASVATAMQAVNSIPALCEAEPGWRSSVELGLVSTGIGFRNASG